MSKEAVVHAGRGITHSGLSEQDEAFLAALVLGKLPLDDGDDVHKQLILRARLSHAYSTDPESVEAGRELLELWDIEPDDAATRKEVATWLEELKEARLISFGGKGRRTDKEMAWLKFRLYMLASQERPTTVRGMMYRMEAAGYLPKDERAYNLVQRAVLNMRRAGLMPWRWITDSSRRVWGKVRFGDMESYASHVAANYRKDYWASSPVNVEVWCEKDAMQGVIAPVVLEEFGLDLYVSKGQSSASYLYEAAEQVKEDGRPTVVYVLSDFDPAGFRIAQKIEEGLREHIPAEQSLSVERVAVSYEQVQRYNLVTRPVKKSDKGAPDFIARYGDECCELEAMPANTLRDLLREHLHTHMSSDRLRILKMVEEEERGGLAQIQDLLGGAA